MNLNPNVVFPNTGFSFSFWIQNNTNLNASYTYTLVQHTVSGAQISLPNLTLTSSNMKLSSSQITMPFIFTNWNFIYIGILCGANGISTIYYQTTSLMQSNTVFNGSSNANCNDLSLQAVSIQLNTDFQNSNETGFVYKEFRYYNFLNNTIYRELASTESSFPF